MTGPAMLPFDGGAGDAREGAGAPQTLQQSSAVQDKARNFNAAKLLEGERYKELDRRQSYYDCTQHNWKRYDFEGRIMRPGAPTSQPLISSEQASWYVPLKLRRPSSPYRLARVIVGSFTSMLFGEQRFPTVHVPGDEDTTEFVKALATACNLPSKMVRARNLGGCMGTVGLSWCFRDGKPRVDVHNAKYLHVEEWADRDDLVPAHVIEVFRYSQEEWDAGKKQFVKKWYWHRRDWTEEADVVFKPVPADPKTSPLWIVDQERSNQHNDGVCHFVWVQNIPGEEADGLPDYDGLYENFDALDTLCSVLARGTTLNLDPTLVLKVDPTLFGRGGVRKGSDNALALGETGDAEYLELGGSSVEAGIKLFNMKRTCALEVAKCVIPDPNQIAAESSVAMKVVYAPMTQQTDLLREPYGEGVRRLLQAMVDVVRAKGDEYEVVLPPKVRAEPEVDAETGKPTGEQKVTTEDHHPGEGTVYELHWGPYFVPTAADQQATVTTLSTATGGKAFMSAQSATEILAEVFGRDPVDEWKRLTQANLDEREERMQDFAGDPGGQVGAEGQLPGGARPRGLPSPADGEEDDGAAPGGKGKKPGGPAPGV